MVTRGKCFFLGGLLRWRKIGRGRKSYEQTDVVVKGGSFGKSIKLSEREDCSWMDNIHTELEDQSVNLATEPETTVKKS